MKYLRKENKKEPVLLRHERVLLAAGLLFTMTLITFHFVDLLYARYTRAEEGSDSARVAAAGSVRVSESKAVYNAAAGEYSLDTTQIVSSNKYSVIVPGLEIPKDSFVTVSGGREVAYDLYLEVAATASSANVNTNILNYTVRSDYWQSSAETPKHGGTVYKYTAFVPPGGQMIIPIITGNKITLSDDIRDITNITQNGGNVKLDIYAYLIQKD